MVSVFHFNLDVEMVDIPKYLAGALGDEQMSKRLLYFCLLAMSERP